MQSMLLFLSAIRREGFASFPWPEPKTKKQSMGAQAWQSPTASPGVRLSQPSHCVSHPLPQPLWDHRSTGQLRTLIPRGYLEYCEVSGLRQRIFGLNLPKKAEHGNIRNASIVLPRFVQKVPKV